MKNYLIVGGSSGIGLALSKSLAEANAGNIWVISRQNNPELAALNVQHIPLDITTDTDSIAQALSQLPDTLHGVAYCPGSINLKPFQRLSIADFQQDLDINFFGAIKILQNSMKALRKAKGASVVLFSTVAAQTGMNFHSSIASAKAAVEGLTRSLAAEWALHKIRVNAIAPSLTDTPLAGKILSSADKKEASGKRHPVGRVGEAKDIAALAEFLLSEKADWITGQIIGVDGGMGSLKP